jgi:hypothetical protein
LAHVVQDRPVAGVQLKVVAPAACNCVLSPAQIALFVAAAVTFGTLSTFTVICAVFEQPAAEVPVTVYVVVAVGDANGLAQLLQDSPVDGDQL